MDALRYPIGLYTFPEPVPHDWIKEQLEVLQHFPNQVKQVLKDFSAETLLLRYRPGGWTAKEVIHHCADSHMHAYIRCKCALTEKEPVIKPYDEAAWAALPDGQLLPVEVSVQLLDALHRRWVSCLSALEGEQWQQAYFHPESQRRITLLEVLGNYAWHCRHHLAHLHLCKEKGVK